MRISDTITVVIPQHLTVDFGYAVWRGQQHRLRKIRKWQEKHFGPEKEQAAEGDDKEEEIKEKKADDGPSFQTSSNGMRKDQFGGIVDYLEAKYVRGVMVDDVPTEEKLRQKRKRAIDRKMKELKEKGDDEVASVKDEDIKDDDLSMSEDEARSTYSADSFLDDSQLVQDVAGQVKAASGLTKIEAQAKRGKEKFGEEGGTQFTSDYNGLLQGYDGFFVNVGDIEMENEEDQDDDDFYIDWAAPPKPKKKKKKKDATQEVGEKQAPKVVEGVPKKKKKKSIDSTASGKPEENKETPKKKKTKTDSTPVKKGSGNASVTSKGSVAKKPPKLTEDAKKELYKLRGRCKKLNNDRQKLYKKCVAEIQNMLKDTEQSYMPRKDKGGKMETIKVTLSVPEGKKPGDPLMFNNPRDPNQMLRVTIPVNAKPGGTFMVSLPVPKMASSEFAGEENNFSKAMKEILHDYATKYDEWMDVDYEIKERCGKPPKVTIHKAKMQKFDELVKEFPSDLEIPVDIPFLRKVVRRTTQNKKKRKESMERNNLLLQPAAKKAKKNPVEEESDEDTDGNRKMIPMHAPSRNTKFDTRAFDLNDFPRHHGSSK